MGPTGSSDCKYHLFSVELLNANGDCRELPVGFKVSDLGSGVHGVRTSERMFCFLRTKRDAFLT